MNKYVSLIFAFALLLFFSGCSGLAKMKPAKRLQFAPPEKALVNFVRPYNFAGGGSNRDLWHEDEYIGSISNASMVQYLVEPGMQLFMTNNYNKGWKHLYLNVEAGKTYYVRVEVYFSGFELEKIAQLDYKTKSWIDELLVTSIDAKNSKAIPSSEIASAKRNAARFKSTNTIIKTNQ